MSGIHSASFVIVLVLFGILPAIVLAGDGLMSGEELLRRSLATVAGSVEKLWNPGVAYQARIRMVRNEGEGPFDQFIIETSSSTLRQVRADHTIAKGGRRAVFRRYLMRDGQNSWLLDYDGHEDLFEAQRIHSNQAEPKAIPYDLRVLARALLTPEWEITCSNRDNAILEGVVCVAVYSEVVIGESIYAYDYYADAATLTPVRRVRTHDGSVAGFREWQRFGDLNLPVRVEYSVPDNEKVYDLIMLEEITWDLDIPEDYLVLPPCHEVVD